MLYAIVKRPKRWPWAFLFKKYRGKRGKKLYGHTRVGKKCPGVLCQDRQYLPPRHRQLAPTQKMMSDGGKEMIVAIDPNNPDVSGLRIAWGPGTRNELVAELRRRRCA